MTPKSESGEPKAFVKRSEVWAMQYSAKTCEAMCRWLRYDHDCGDDWKCGDDGFVVEATREGTIEIGSGDWVVIDNHEVQVWPDKAFAKTFAAKEQA